MAKSNGNEPALSRAKAGQSQAEAAQLLGIHIRTWQAWEQGITPIPAPLLELYRHKAGVERIPFAAVGYPRPEAQ